MITIHDDKKERHQSFEAQLDECSPLIAELLFPQFWGYGADEEAALAELKQRVAEQITRLQAIDFTQIRRV